MKCFLKLSVWLLLLSTPEILRAQQSYTGYKWKVLDIPFDSRKRIENPFDVIFGAIITHQNGKNLQIPGFYNNDDSWLLRFSLPDEGTWSFTTNSTLPGLSGISGLIIIKPDRKKEEHGPVEISRTNPQRFIYADGTNYFLSAFELDWLFALDWDNPKDIPKTREIVGHVKENGFNQIVMNVYAYDASWGERDKINPEHNFANPKVFPFAGTNENPDFSRLNMPFFQHLDRVIDHLNDQEIIAHLMIYVWNKKVNWPEPNSTADNLYFDYVVKRYQAFPNLVWDISKEVLAYGRDDMNYITERIDRLRKLDGYHRLLSVHDYAYCAAYPDKVDFISIQDWNPDLYNRMRVVANTHSNKPIFNIEHGGYEKTIHSIFRGAYSDPETCLDRNYQCVFAGTYSTYYWQNTSWYEVIYNPFTLPKENQPHFSWYKQLANFFTLYDFNKLTPESGTSNTFCLTDNESIFIFYISKNMDALTGNLPELKGKTAKIKWFDPFSGDFFDAGKKDFTNGTWIAVSKPEKFTASFGIAILEVE